MRYPCWGWDETQQLYSSLFSFVLCQLVFIDFLWGSFIVLKGSKMSLWNPSWVFFAGLGCLDILHLHLLLENYSVTSFVWIKKKSSVRLGKFRKNPKKIGKTKEVELKKGTARSGKSLEQKCCRRWSSGEMQRQKRRPFGFFEEFESKGSFLGEVSQVRVRAIFIYFSLITRNQMVMGQNENPWGPPNDFCWDPFLTHNQIEPSLTSNISVKVRRCFKVPRKRSRDRLHRRADALLGSPLCVAKRNVLPSETSFCRKRIRSEAQEESKRKKREKQLKEFAQARECNVLKQRKKVFAKMIAEAYRKQREEEKRQVWFLNPFETSLISQKTSKTCNLKHFHIQETTENGVSHVQRTIAWGSNGRASLSEGGAAAFGGVNSTLRSSERFAQVFLGRFSFNKCFYKLAKISFNHVSLIFSESEVEISQEDKQRIVQRNLDMLMRKLQALHWRDDETNLSKGNMTYFEIKVFFFERRMKDFEYLWIFLNEEDLFIYFQEFLLSKETKARLDRLGNPEAASRISATEEISDAFRVVRLSRFAYF